MDESELYLLIDCCIIEVTHARQRYFYFNVNADVLLPDLRNATNAFSVVLFFKLPYEQICVVAA